MIGQEGKVVPSMITAVEWTERKLCIREQIEAVEPEEGSLESKDLCHFLSNALEILRALKKFHKSLREEDQKSYSQQITSRPSSVKSILVIWKSR